MTDKIPGTRWLRVIAPILVTCIISFMDRVNISFALPGGMEQDLGITSQMAGVASGIFFIGYLFLQIPGGRLAVYGSGKRFIAWSLVAWAIVSIATGFVTHQYQLLVLRFILGISEGGMLPVVLTMVSNWFPEKELGRANAFVMMFAPLGGMLTAPVSGAIIATLDWRWLFIIEGQIAILGMRRKTASQQQRRCQRVGDFIHLLSRARSTSLAALSPSAAIVNVVLTTLAETMAPPPGIQRLS